MAWSRFLSSCVFSIFWEPRLRPFCLSVTIAAMGVAALGLTDHLMRPRAAAMGRFNLR
jgi:hypothetical protein